jgi:hypothetical protein
MTCAFFRRRRRVARTVRLTFFAAVLLSCSSLFMLDDDASFVITSPPAAALRTSVAPPVPRYGSVPVTLFMSENRPFQVGMRLSQADYWTLAAAINYLYATRHGYTLHYYHVQLNASALGVDQAHARSGGWACYNLHLGIPRHPSWCKLLPGWLESSTPTVDVTHLQPPVSARNATPAPRVEQVALFFDSDSFVVDEEASVADLMYGPRYWSAGRSWLRPMEDAAVVFLRDVGWDFGGNGYANGGFFLLRPGPEARRFFQLWWNVNDTAFNLRHSYEQNSLNDGVKDHPRLNVNVAELLDVMDVNNTGRQWLRHLPGFYPPWTRSGLMRDHLERLGINNDTFIALTQEMVARGVVVPLDSVAVAAALEQAAKADALS